MSDRPGSSSASTPVAAAAVAQTRTAGASEVAPAPPGAAGPPATRAEEEADGFTIGAGVERAATGLPYERRPNDPIYRPLWIYTIDPAASQFEGAQAIINVPY